MTQRFGMAYIAVDGDLQPTMPGAKLDTGGVERTPVEGDNKMLGFTEKPKPAMVTFDISLGPTMSLKRLQDMKNATVTFECDTGQTYVMRGAYTTKTLALTSGDNGKVNVEMAGMPAEEMGA
jgi:Phage tail tube protein